MEYLSTLIAPAHRCHIILYQEGDKFVIRKHVKDPLQIGKAVDSYKPFLDLPTKVCVVFESRGRIYNFDIDKEE